jgi:hypothetical protein
MQNKLKLVILIISSDNEAVYAKMKEMSQKYLELFKTKNEDAPWYEYFYVEFNSNIEDDIFVEKNTIFVKGNETFAPGLFEKTLKSMKYIVENFEFSYLMRTNLSTFLNLENVHSFIFSLEQQKSQKYFGGFTIEDVVFTKKNIVSGTGIFASNDIVNYLISKYEDNRKYELPDDVLFSNIIYDTHNSNDEKIEVQNITNYKMGYLISYNEWNKPYSAIDLSIGDFNPNLSFPENILYFRIKNGADRNIDLQYYKLLIEKIYNIAV